MRKPRTPSYRLHRASGQAIVVLSGHMHYLGVYDSPESHQEYERLVAEWLAGRRNPIVARASDLTVSEVLAAYLGHAQGRYTGADLHRVKQALRAVRRLYGTTPARDFGGRAVKAVREAMAQSGLNRRSVNQRVDVIRRCWKWALAEELVPADRAQSVLAVTGLRAGESDCPEPGKVQPVEPAVYEATLPHLPPFLADVARVQALAGVRPGEALAIRGEDLDRSRPDLWVWSPRKHKTAWRGHRRQAFLGPRAITVLDQYLFRRCPACGRAGRTGALAWRGCLCGPCADRADELGVCGPWPDHVVELDRYLFSPRLATEERHARMRAARKTPVQPSQRNRARDEPRKGPGERYNRESYTRAVARACKLAGVEHWHPHQLRHLVGTLVAREHGWEAARIYLGHRSLDVTRIYAEDDLERVREVARRFG